jgi:hypothetical protein
MAGTCPLIRRRKRLSVAGELTTDILCALGPADGGHATVLPALRHLRVENPMAMNEPSWDALQSFINSRSLSGRPVQVNVPLPSATSVMQFQRAARTQTSP